MFSRPTGAHEEAQRSLSVLQFFLRDHHPRNYAFRCWDGSVWEAEAGQPTRFTMVLQHPGSVCRMFLPATERNLGEAYIYDDIDIEGDMEGVFSMAEHLVGLHLSLPEKIRIGAQLLGLPSQRRARIGRQAVILKGGPHSIERDRRAVTYHYDTSNDFFSLYLDKRMVYSCAYFAEPSDSLETAQAHKLDYICRKLRLRRGDRLLDIGCGWGGLLLFAAKHYGVTALGITLSEPQAELAKERIAKERLQDVCRVEVRDYREIEGAAAFDRIASIGMVEHVGEKKLPEYFAQAWRMLRPGGLFLNHGIAHPPTFHSNPRRSFSQAYVFPDGNPASIDVETHCAELAGFEVRDIESLREHYAMTLRHWVRRLEAHRDEAIRLTDEPTYRTWRLFMSASAHGFETGQYNIYQSLLLKPDQGKSRLPLTRRDLYK
jgi:cyclopropane-fatty-acyl-phospholipid synthase